MSNKKVTIHKPNRYRKSVHVKTKNVNGFKVKTYKDGSLKVLGHARKSVRVVTTSNNPTNKKSSYKEKAPAITSQKSLKDWFISAGTAISNRASATKDSIANKAKLIYNYFNKFEKTQSLAFAAMAIGSLAAGIGASIVALSTAGVEAGIIFPAMIIGMVVATLAVLPVALYIDYVHAKSAAIEEQTEGGKNNSIFNSPLTKFEKFVLDYTKTKLKGVNEFKITQRNIANWSGNAGFVGAGIGSIVPGLRAIFGYVIGYTVGATAAMVTGPVLDALFANRDSLKGVPILDSLSATVKGYEKKKLHKAEEQGYRGYQALYYPQALLTFLNANIALPSWAVTSLIGLTLGSLPKLADYLFTGAMDPVSGYDMKGIGFTIQNNNNKRQEKLKKIEELNVNIKRLNTELNALKQNLSEKQQAKADAENLANQINKLQINSEEAKEQDGKLDEILKKHGSIEAITTATTQLENQIKTANTRKEVLEKEIKSLKNDLGITTIQQKKVKDLSPKGILPPEGKITAPLA